jgi:hypothetical protein
LPDEFHGFPTTGRYVAGMAGVLFFVSRRRSTSR